MVDDCIVALSAWTRGREERWEVRNLRGDDWIESLLCSSCFGVMAVFTADEEYERGGGGKV